MKRPLIQPIFQGHQSTIIVILLTCSFGLSGSASQTAAVPLGSYDEVLAALESGGKIRVAVDGVACGLNMSSNSAAGYRQEGSDVYGYIPLDTWQWFDIGGAPSIAFSSAFITHRPSPTPLFVRFNGRLGADNQFNLTVEDIEPVVWEALETFQLSCSLAEGGGAQFLLEEDPERIPLDNYADLEAALESGYQVTRVANYSRCVEPTPFLTVSGSPVTLFEQFEKGDPDREFLKIVDTVLVSNMAEGSPYAINSNHMNVHASNNSVKVNPAMWDTIEWDNDYYRPEGYVCEMGEEGIQFLAEAGSGETEEDLATLDELLAALQDGYSVKFKIDDSKCDGAFAGTSELNTVLYGEIGFWSYVRRSDGLRDIAFTTSYYTESGLLHYDQHGIIYTEEDGEFVVVLSTEADPATGLILAEETMICLIKGPAAQNGAAEYRRRTDEPIQQLEDFDAVRLALESGSRIGLTANLKECSGDTSTNSEFWYGVSPDVQVLFVDSETGTEHVFTAEQRYATIFMPVIQAVTFDIYREGPSLVTGAPYEFFGFQQMSNPVEFQCDLNDGASGAIRIVAKS